MAEKERSQALPSPELHRLHVLARTGQIAHRLLVTSRHPHRRQLPGPVKTCQAHRVAAIRHHPIPRLARDQARGYDLAVVAGLGNLAIHSVAAGTRFIGKAQRLSVRSLQTTDQSLERGLRFGRNPRYSGSARPGHATAAAIVSLCTSSPTYPLYSAIDLSSSMWLCAQ